MSPPLDRLRGARSPALVALVAAAAFVALGLVYIRWSSAAAASIAPDVERLQELEIGKGQIFILAMGALVFLLVWAPVATIERERRRREELERALANAESSHLPLLFASTLAHDLNNVLQVAFLHAADASEAAGELGRPSARGLEQSLGELAAMVDRLRSVARLRPRTREPFELDAAVVDALELARPHPALRHCRLESALGSGARLAGDRSLLSRAILNLVINGAEASPTGRVTVASEAANGRAAVVVDDDGPGVPEELRREIFRPFYTTKPKGSGLGLASVREAARSLTGAVTVERSPLGGARFRIDVPVPTDGSKRTDEVA